MALEGGPRQNQNQRTGVQSGSARMQEAAEKKAMSEVKQKIEQHKEKIELNTSVRDVNRVKNRTTGRPVKNGKELSSSQRHERQHRREQRSHDRRAHQRADQEIARRQAATRIAQAQSRNRSVVRQNASVSESEAEMIQGEQLLDAQARIDQRTSSGSLENIPGGITTSTESLANGDLSEKNKVISNDVFQQKLQERNVQQDQTPQNATDIGTVTSTELDPALGSLENVDAGLDQLRDLLIELFLKDKKIRKKANLIATLGAILTMAAIRIQDILEERGLNDLTDEQMEDLEDFMQQQREAALKEAEEADLLEQQENELEDTDEEIQKRKAKTASV